MIYEWSKCFLSSYYFRLSSAWFWNFCVGFDSLFHCSHSKFFENKKCDCIVFGTSKSMTVSFVFLFDFQKFWKHFWNCHLVWIRIYIPNLVSQIETLNRVKLNDSYHSYVHKLYMLRIWLLIWTERNETIRTADLWVVWMSKFFIWKWFLI